MTAPALLGMEMLAAVDEPSPSPAESWLFTQPPRERARPASQPSQIRLHQTHRAERWMASLAWGGRLPYPSPTPTHLIRLPCQAERWG